MNTRAQIAVWVTHQGTAATAIASSQPAGAPVLTRRRISARRLWLAAAVVVVVTASGVVVWLLQPSGPTIVTIAGTWPNGQAFSFRGGYAGENVPATTALMSLPSDVAIARDGTIYMADYGNRRIRRLAGDGSIVTVAGNPKGPLVVDGAFGRDVDIGFASSIEVDSDGNVYMLTIRDGTLEVWMVQPSHVMNLVVRLGPSKVVVSDFWPSHVGGLVVRDDGTLYIADRAGNRVYRRDPGGQPFPYAGTGQAGWSGDDAAATAAELNSPIGLALDQQGDLYIADSGNNRIRKVDKNGRITTFAGIGGFYGDGGDGGPALQARLSFPFGVAIARDGTLFIADTGNNRLRKVTRSGRIEALAGTGQSGFMGDGGPASRAEFRAPEGIALDVAGNLFVADTINQRVRKLPAVTTRGGSRS